MTYDDLLRYIDKSVREEQEADPDGDPIFWAVLSAVAFYTEAWRTGDEMALKLADSVGAAVTDAFVLEVLAEHCGESGDFEEWRKDHSPTLTQ